jgi:4-alpha-glucanotransferase
MKFSGFSHYGTGVAVPVSALRTAKSFGIGEFSDLVLLGEWCRDAALDLIQILPVNDTGPQSSPYSALSAFALHPVYIRLSDLPELQGTKKAVKQIAGEIEKSRREFEKHPRVRFGEVLAAKLAFLRRIYAASADSVAKDRNLKEWITRNPWVRAYALFCRLKEKNNGASWTHWKTFRIPTEAMISEAWESPGEGEEIRFYAWVQMRLEEQFRSAAEALDTMGVLLKGDLPILMSEDSADVWVHPDFFRRDLRAGAPPDMFSDTGQNWGFPVYDWEALRKADYSWWKDRLRRAALFYHAYRIDHVLGFFRIWAIPEGETSGVLGYFKPSNFIHKKELYSRGFDDGRIRWLTKPHVPGGEVREAFGAEADLVLEEVFSRIGTEDLFLFRDRVNEKIIEELPLSGEGKKFLIRRYRDRALLVVPPDSLAPAWYRDGSRAFGTLGKEERWTLDDLISRYFRDSEERWAREGEELLWFMKNTTDMLTCAEDLGVVPDCVPRVLEELNILGLKIPRWTRRYKEPGEPYVAPKDYPLKTVCAPSVHDTSTLRGWWEEEADRDAFWKVLGLSGPAPRDCGPDTAGKIFSGLLGTGSVLAMFQLQDYFSLSRDFRAADPGEERINIPGTVSETNWSYRMPFTLEDLCEKKALRNTIRKLVEGRRKRPLADWESGS